MHDCGMLRTSGAQVTGDGAINARRDVLLLGSVLRGRSPTPASGKHNGQRNQHYGACRQPHLASRFHAPTVLPRSWSCEITDVQTSAGRIHDWKWVIGNDWDYVMGSLDSLSSKARTRSDILTSISSNSSACSALECTTIRLCRM
jgi:hypothetical protein